MRVFAHCNKEGVISSLVAFEAPRGLEFSLAPKPGEYVVEIEGLKLKAGAPDPEWLQKLARTHRVSKVETRSTLTKKT